MSNSWRWYLVGSVVQVAPQIQYIQDLLEVAYILTNFLAFGYRHYTEVDWLSMNLLNDS